MIRWRCFRCFGQHDLTYTEVEYCTRDGVEIGVFWKEKKSEWTIYIKTKKYVGRSMSTFKAEELALLIKNLKDAKQMIDEKTGEPFPIPNEIKELMKNINE